MVYDRYSRGNPQGDGYGRNEGGDYSRPYGSGREQAYSSARDYRAAGYLGDDDDRGSFGRRNEERYGGRGQGHDYGERGGFGQQGYGRQDYGRQDYGRQDYGRGEQRGGYERDYGSGYGNVGPARGWYGARDDDRGGRYGRQEGGWRDREEGRDGGRRDYGRQPQGYQYVDRGFIARAGDEVRSWFGDEDAERRRDMDQRGDERHAHERDSDYHNWRRGQMEALDRDYHEYRQENRSKFESEFSTWRTTRQGQRDALNRVKEHMEVVGSDGEHVGTVDKVRGDRILLTKNDADAGGRHHSIPSRWLSTVDDKVTLSKTSAEAKQAWRDEESNGAMFGYGDRTEEQGRIEDRSRTEDRNRDRGTDLNRSFSGTY